MDIENSAVMLVRSHIETVTPILRSITPMDSKCQHILFAHNRGAYAIPLMVQMTHFIEGLTFRPMLPYIFKTDYVCLGSWEPNTIS